MRLHFLTLPAEDRRLYIVQTASRRNVSPVLLAASRAIDQHDLRNRVVAWKGQFFGSSWASYDLAKPGTFRLVAPAARLPALRRDYQSMRDMYLSEPAPFDDVLATLAALERRINQARGG